jgi:hypothetical protein
MDKFTNIIETETGEQVQFIDSRYYTKDKITWYPGISTILDVVSKGKQYDFWLKSLGFNADYVMREAMNKGSNCHAAIQTLLQGYELSFGEIGKPNYTRDEWIMISRFVDFYTEFKPETIAIEQVLVSEALGFGSQIDYVCMLNGERWLIDHKTGSLYDSASIQTSAYKQLWDEYFPEQPIQRVGILHLDSTHRGRDKTGKSIQGVGWKLIEVEDIEKNFEDFKHIQAIWKRKNPDYKPFNLIYPAMYKLTTDEPTGA